MKLEIGFLRFSKFPYFSWHFSCLSQKLDSTHSTLCLFRSYCKVGRFYSLCLLPYVCLSLIQIVGIDSFVCSQLINFMIFISCSLEKNKFCILSCMFLLHLLHICWDLFHMFLFIYRTKNMND